MNTTEVSQFLARVAAQDNRQVGPMQIMDWEDLLPPTLTLADALDALREHRRSSTDYLQAAHIIKIPDRRRDETERQRVREANPPDIPPDMDQISERDWLRHYWTAVKAGHPAPQTVADIATGANRPELAAPDPERIRELLTALAARKDAS